MSRHQMILRRASLLAMSLVCVACGTVDDFSPSPAKEPDVVSQSRPPPACGSAQEVGVCIQRCGTPKVTAEQREIVRRALADTVGEMRFGNGHGLTTIDVWFHVINTGSSTTQGNVPESWLDGQIRVLNEAYGDATGGAKTRFNFVKRGVTRTTNSSWFTQTLSTPPNSNELAMKTALHTGGATTLNIYTVDTGIYLGWSRFPWELTDTNGAALDGLIIDFRSMPGGSLAPYDLGLTAAHEAGHWLGLIHPFEDECGGTDDVNDTPQMKQPVYGCPGSGAVVDSCPALPGTDPLHNYMGYVDDACMWEFTSGQATRMGSMYTTLRGGVLSSVDGIITQQLWQTPITSTIDGGAVDYDTQNTAILVRAYWDAPAGATTAYTEVTANLVSTYMNEVYGVTGNHGFQITVPALYRNGQEHTAYLYGLDSSSGALSLLTYAPVKFTISP
jgi:hypothetical protein